MQSLFDSFCRCFEGGHPGMDMEVITDSAEGGIQENKKVVPSTPDMKRRTRSLKLQDEQWDALFDCNGTGMISSNRGCGGVVGESACMEQARAVAKAKLEANGNKKTQKRKRATAEEIFRSKKASAAREEPPANPFSRFLSNNPVIAHSLCFATPVRDPDEPDTEDYNSVVSESHTLNTAEDTMTSTVYYEQVKLAGLKQRNPPMPLFSAYEIKNGEDIRDVVESDTHSSVMMKEWVMKNPQVLQVHQQERLTPPASPTRYEHSEHSDDVPSPPRKGDDDEVPPMVNSSSSGSGNTARSV
eukprot:scaffold294_cov221-Amphora_coffeaeformis.AAC.15